MAEGQDWENGESREDGAGRGIRENGESGARGEIGENGESGARGETGENGERGARGEIGENGESGARGEIRENKESGAREGIREKGESGGIRENKRLRKKILVIGSLNMDMVVSADHIPLAGETILGKKMTLVPGGKGANQACAAGRLGADTVMLGALGEDSHGKLLESSLRKSGVDASRLLWRRDAETGLAMITVSDSGENSIVVVPGANATLTPQDLDANRDLMEECDGVIMQMEIPIETVCHGARLAKSLGKPVILDPAPVPKSFPEELYGYADILKPNETELGMLTGIRDVTAHLEEAAELVRRRGGRDLVVTLGEKGVFIASKVWGTHRIPALKVKAVDTTAAGDAFTAALAYQLLEGRSLVEAAEFANLVSAIVVTRKGAQSSIPSMEEVEACRNAFEPRRG